MIGKSMFRYKKTQPTQNSKRSMQRSNIQIYVYLLIIHLYYSGNISTMSFSPPHPAIPAK